MSPTAVFGIRVQAGRNSALTRREQGKTEERKEGTHTHTHFHMAGTTKHHFYVAGLRKSLKIKSDVFGCGRAYTPQDCRKYARK